MCGGLHLTLKLWYVTFYVFAKMKDVDRAITELLCLLIEGRGLLSTFKLQYVNFYLFAKMKAKDRSVPEHLWLWWWGLTSYFKAAACNHLLQFRAVLEL